MSLGENLRLLREDKKISQLELSRHLNISNSTLSLYESDKRKPDYEILVRLAEYFSVSTDYLLGVLPVKGSGRKDQRVVYSIDVSGLPDDAVRQIDEYAQFIREKYNPYDKKK